MFFSVSAVAFSVECLIILYRLYAESILTAWRSDLPLVFFFFLGGGRGGGGYCENVPA